jgi:hypothetical protein
MYWIWQSLRANDNEARIADRPAVISELGVRFDEGARIQVAVPMIRMIRDEDSQGQLTDNLIAPGSTGLVLSSRLRQLLTAHGVHNIEYYPVVLENPIDNMRTDDYQLGNVIGRVACFDLEQSELHRNPRTGAIEFIDALALDQTKIGELRMFRSAEHAQVIVVHDDIRNACVAANITGVMFVRPANFSM